MNRWETVMWASVAVIPVCAVITTVVHDNWSGAWVLVMSAVVILIAIRGERHRVLRRRNRD